MMTSIKLPTNPQMVCVACNVTNKFEKWKNQKLKLFQIKFRLNKVFRVIVRSCYLCC